MYIFKIIGLIMTMSPIVIEIKGYSFPYSMLGYTLFILATLFSKITISSIFTFVFWGLSAYYLYADFILFYQLFLITFVISQFLYLLFTTNKHWFSVLSIIGILASCVGWIIPISFIIGLMILCLLFIYNRPSQQITHHMSEPELQNILISNLETPTQEEEYVIPKE